MRKFSLIPAILAVITLGLVTQARAAFPTITLPADLEPDAFLEGALTAAGPYILPVVTGTIVIAVLVAVVKMVRNAPKKVAK